MKKILPIALLVLVSCHKPDKPVPKQTMSTDSIHHFIRNWATIPIWNGWDKPDTMYCYSSYDTSYVMYRNEKLYLWSTTKPFNDSAEVIYNCYIGKQCFDSSTAYSKCEVSGSMYYNGSAWQGNHQTIWVYDKSHFDTTGEGIYSNF
ncbi:MAG TPA: hypothetical protein VN721_01810 [Flavipsychrobacter sp.]|nr:hypothetical protein [Flavipsychrobacter sp.]